MLLFALAKVLDVRLKPRGSCGAVSCLCSERDQAVGGEAGPARAVPPPLFADPHCLSHTLLGPAQQGGPRIELQTEIVLAFV